MTKTKISALSIALALLASSLSSTQVHGATEAPAAPSALGITVGIYQPPTVNYGTEIASVNRLTGKSNGVVMYYLDWNLAYNPFLENQIIQQMPAAERPVTMIDWTPRFGKQAQGCDQDYDSNGGGIPFDKIIGGACDRYITKYAQDMKAHGGRFLLKFAHEMNLNIWPWSPVSAFQNQPISKFIDMWRHVRTIFKNQGATNVEFVWNPLYQGLPNTPENDVALYYPGDDYVDWVALHGYNFLDKIPGIPYAYSSFDTMFKARLQEFACKYKKPQMIGEMGSVEDTTTQQHPKASWIAEAYQQAASYPFLRAVVYYNAKDFGNASIDYRISGNTAFDGGVSALPAGSGAWTTAYKNAIAPATYTSILPTLAEATPPTTYCGTNPPTPTLTLSPASLFLKAGEGATLNLTSLFFSDSPLIAIDAPTGITVVASPRSVPSPWGTVSLTLRTTTALADGIYTVKITAGGATQILTVYAGDLQNVFLPVIVQ